MIINKISRHSKAFSSFVNQKYSRGKGNLFYRFASALVPRSKVALTGVAAGGAAVWVGIYFTNMASQKRNTQFFKAIMSTISLDPAIIKYLNTVPDDITGPNVPAPFVKVQDFCRGWVPVAFPNGHVNMIKGTADLKFDIVGNNPARKAHVVVKAKRTGPTVHSPWDMQTFKIVIPAENCPDSLKAQLEPSFSESAKSVYKPYYYILKDFTQA